MNSLESDFDDVILDSIGLVVGFITAKFRVFQVTITNRFEIVFVCEYEFSVWLSCEDSHLNYCVYKSSYGLKFSYARVMF